MEIKDQWFMVECENTSGNRFEVGPRHTSSSAAEAYLKDYVQPSFQKKDRKKMNWFIVDYHTVREAAQVWV